MDDFTFNNQAFAGYDSDSQSIRNFYLSNMWHMPVDQPLPSHDLQSHHNNQHLHQSHQQQQQHPHHHEAMASAPADQYEFENHLQRLNQSRNAIMARHSMMGTTWPFSSQQSSNHTQQTQQALVHNNQFSSHPYSAACQPSLHQTSMDFASQQHTTIDSAMNMHTAAEAAFIPYSTSMDGPFEPLIHYQNDLQDGLVGYPLDQRFQTQTFGQQNLLSTSPTETSLDVQSSSGSESGWQLVDVASSRRSFDSYSAAVSNPALTLHVRTNSNSSHGEVTGSAASVNSFGSYEEVHIPLSSPQSEGTLDFTMQHDPSQSQQDGVNTSPDGTCSSPSSSSTSPKSLTSTSPTSRKRKDPIAKPSNKVFKKPAPATKKIGPEGKRVGRRKGPLRPEQRIQAGEIRKLRACLRCKFLKKTCDKGDPCAGCRPSHARLWQVPCTRIDIKDIGYFIKDWRADYERHVTLGNSIANIKGYSSMERPLFITHGYGFVMPIQAREVYVRDDDCFNIDWVESCHETPREFDQPTARLTLGVDGISHSMISEYLDRHIDGGFEAFVDKHFEGTKFLTEMLKTAYRFHLRTRLPIIRKALQLVLAYNLTLHVTMVEGLSEEEGFSGKVDDEGSKHHGRTLAPVMINFQIKHALALMWRELQRDVLEELSALYSSVYSGEKLKHWPTIFMLASMLLAVWEEVQFDSHYRSPDPEVVKKFCNEMETTPVGVIVGLFSAISQKLPAFRDWDTREHHQLLNSEGAVCDAMTEVKDHVLKYEDYLKERSDCKFDRNDFDCLSNKFLSKLVIRAS